MHRIMTRRGAPRIATALVAVALVGIAAPASAHVEVSSTDAQQGAEAAKIAFRVPTESDTASTTSITVTFPTDTPITSVSAQSKPGWTATTASVQLDPPVVNGNVTLKSAIGTITWTATDGGIPPGQFDTFTAQIGPIQDQAQLLLPTLQTYSDGSTVDWSEVSTDGTEPEHPAPALAITQAPATGATDAPSVSAEPVAASADGDGSATAVGIVGILAGVVGLVIAVVALVTARRRIRRD